MAVAEEIVIERVFDAPRERVFKAWTEPAGIAAWYGPEGFDTPVERIAVDLRAGGSYELTMVRRDGGGEFRVRYEIVELVEPELLVLRSDEATLTRVELHDERGRTRMRLTDGPYPGGAGHAEAGWTSAFDTLAAYLAS